MPSGRAKNAGNSELADVAVSSSFSGLDFGGSDMACAMYGLMNYEVCRPVGCAQANFNLIWDCHAPNYLSICAGVGAVRLGIVPFDP